MSEQAKRAARRNWRKLTARHEGGIPTDRVPSAEGARFAFSSLPLPDALFTDKYQCPHCEWSIRVFRGSAAVLAAHVRQYHR